jgi:hypothetical protein
MHDVRPLVTDVNSRAATPHPFSPQGRLLQLSKKQEADILRHKQSKAKEPPAPPTPVVPNNLNDAVRMAAEDQVGQPVVGDGECFALADKIMRKALAKTAKDFGTVVPNADYKWGTEVTPLSTLKPGDVLQFRNHVIEETITITVTKKYDDANVKTEPSVDKKTKKHNRGHHTSIVVGVKGNILTVVEQHVLDPNTGALSTTVRQNEFPLTNDTVKPPPIVTRGKDDAGRYTETWEKVIVRTVSGKIMAYRPQQQ